MMRNSVSPVSLIALILAFIALGGYVFPIQKPIPVIKSGIGQCTLKPGDLDTAAECVIPFGYTFKQLQSVIMTQNFQLAFWNQSFTIFNGNMSLVGLTNGPLANFTDFIERGYTGVGEMMVHFRSDVLSNCEPTNGAIADQYSKDALTWTTLVSVKMDCSSGFQIAGASGLGPGPCSSFNGAGVGAFDCWNNVTLGANVAATNSTIAKNFQNTFNRLVVSGFSATTTDFLYRVDLNFIYGEPLGCTITFSTNSNFTPECGVNMGIELTQPIIIHFAWTAFGM